MGNPVPGSEVLDLEADLQVGTKDSLYKAKIACDRLKYENTREHPNNPKITDPQKQELCTVAMDNLISNTRKHRAEPIMSPEQTAGQFADQLMKEFIHNRNRTHPTELPTFKIAEEILAECKATGGAVYAAKQVDANPAGSCQTLQHVADHFANYPKPELPAEVNTRPKQVAPRSYR